MEMRELGVLSMGFYTLGKYTEINWKIFKTTCCVLYIQS